MDKSLDVTPSEGWTGDFTWDGHFMRMHIATVKHDYDSEDPRTWPLIKDVTQTENKSNYKKSKTPPARMAYEQSVMKEINEQTPMRRDLQAHYLKGGSHHDTLSFPGKFIAYPFNYDASGKLRDYPHITVSDFRHSLFAVGAPDSDVSKIPREPELQDRQVTEKSSQDIALAAIVQALASPESSQLILMAKLQKRLDQAKGDVVKYKKETKDNMEAEATKHKNLQLQDKERFDKAQMANEEEKAVLRRELVRERLRVETEVTRLRMSYASTLASERLRNAAATKQIETLQKELGEQAQELIAARTEVVTTKQKIYAFWAGLQKPEATGQEKRKADVDAQSQQDKKPKIDTTDVELIEV